MLVAITAYVSICYVRAAPVRAYITQFSATKIQKIFGICKYFRRKIPF